MARDIGEIIAAEDVGKQGKIINVSTKRIVFQNPCSLQHGQKLKDQTQELLKNLGYQICNIDDENQSIVLNHALHAGVPLLDVPELLRQKAVLQRGEVVFLELQVRLLQQ